MNKILTILAALLIVATGCAAPPAVNDVKVSQAVKVSPPTWVDRTFSPVANSLWGFDSSVLPVNVTLGSGLALNATTHVLTAGVGAYQPLNTNLTSISGLANGAGWLRNDGAGVFSYTTPTKTDVGLSNVDNTSDATKNSAVATLTNKSIAGSQLTGAFTADGQTMATSRLLGRATAGTGPVEEITLGGGVTFVGGALTVTGSGGGTVTNTGGSLTANRLILGAGGNDTKVVSGINTDGTGSLTLSGSLTASQTGGIIGTTTNNNANAGSVGEEIESVITAGAAVALTSNVVTNITSIPLGAGDWDVSANLCMFIGIGTTLVTVSGVTSSSSGTISLSDPYLFYNIIYGGPLNFGHPISLQRYKLAGATTIYLITQTVFSGGTCGGYGALRARRVR